MKQHKKMAQLAKRIEQFEQQLLDVEEKITPEVQPELLSPVERMTEWVQTTKERLQTSEIIIAAVLCSLILGLTVFALVQSYQWRSAIADIRAEPGIEVLSVERAGLFKKRIVGLRDPLARNVSEIFAKNGVNPKNVEVFLTEYHSLNTAFGRERENLTTKNSEALKKSLVEAVGEFMKSADNRRDGDLEKITRRLFEIRFPKEMESVELEFRNSIWHAKGELLEPAFSSFKTEAPKYIFNGKLHFDDLKNLTKAETSFLRKGIESLNLFARSENDGSLVYLPRIQRLVSEYDSVCQASGMPLPRLQINVLTDDISAHAQEIEQIIKKLETLDTVTSKRFFPYAAAPIQDESEPLQGSLNLISLSSNP